MSLAETTHENGHTLVHTLIALGVSHICIAPGSRSTPLALALRKLPKEMYSVHFDERALGFYALGRAKASKSPVAIIVTSGTATANLFPAVIEASLSHIPLLIITADRPHELRHINANQTIDQVKMFSSYLQFEIDLPLSDTVVKKEYITSRAAYCVEKAKKGPVHINCMIREPFLPIKEATSPSTLPSYMEKASTLTKEAYESLAKLITETEKGIILLGEEEDPSFYEPLIAFAKKCGWPVISDILGRGPFASSYLMDYPLLILKGLPNLKVDGILHIGGRITAKPLAAFLEKQQDAFYMHVSKSSLEYDPSLIITHKAECSPSTFLREIVRRVPKKDNAFWISFWQEKDALVKAALEKFFLEEKKLLEPYILYSVPPTLPLFVGSSMPIRDADLVCQRNALTFGNRGASGIDGNIATASGIASALQKQTIAVIGDLAALHDINSLALAKNSPLILIVINNSGGGIFSFLPIAKEKKGFEELFATTHSQEFSSFAKGFSLPYFLADTKESWDVALEKAQSLNGPCVIECKTSRKENVSHHENLIHTVTKPLCSTTNPLEALKGRLLSFSTAS